MKAKQLLRQIHRVLAPIMLIPIILTLTTGTLYQILDLAGKEESGEWLLNLHKGDFGIVDLDGIYPFLNSLGLLVLAITGISMWLQKQRTAKRRAI